MQIDEKTFEETPYSEATDEVAEQAESEIAEEEGLAEDQDDDADDSETAKRPKVQKRIDEITKARREAERERDFWRMQAQQKAQQQAVPQYSKPTLEQHDYDQEAYLEALADYKVHTTLAQSMAQQAEYQQQQSTAQTVNQFKMREYEVMSEFPDYQQKVYANDVPITDTMATAIRTDENGAKVAYFLATYKDIAYRVANMPQRDQFLAIGEISEKISQAQSAGGLKPSKVSNAPSPIPSMSTRSSVVNKNPEKMSTDEFMAWRNKQLSKR
tara:strand:+ start:1463 stop:2275 length:813 start_codon:yes stop_codon:yes gene_type:complete